MTLYGLKNCDSCRKALLALSTAGHQVKFVDIRISPLDEKQLAALLKSHGEAVLVNRKSLTWRNLENKIRVQPLLYLLTQYPTLIKRPVIYRDENSYVGWSRVVQTAFGL